MRPTSSAEHLLLSNIYLNEVDLMLERARKQTREGKRTCIAYARYANDLVVLLDGQPQNEWLQRKVERRLREELALLEVEVNEEKSPSSRLGVRIVPRFALVTIGLLGSHRALGSLCLREAPRQFARSSRT